MRLHAILVFIIMLTVCLFAQTTSNFTLTLKSATTGQMITDRDVDLYQSGIKKYDMTEISAGKYNHPAVKTGNYDVYVSGSPLAGYQDIFIGGNKLTIIETQFTDTGKLIVSTAMPDSQLAAKHLTQALLDLISSGGNVTNNPDGVTIISAGGFLSVNVNSLDSTFFKSRSIEASDLADALLEGRHFQAGIITGSHIADESISGGKIADDAIDTRHIATSAVGTNEISAISASDIPTGEIDSTHLGSRSVKAPEIADAALLQRHFAVEQIDSSIIVDQGLTGTDIKNKTIPPEKMKMPSGNYGRVLIGDGFGSAIEGQLPTDGLQAAAVTEPKIASDQVVKGVNGLKDNIKIVAGSNATVTTSNDSVIISSTGGGGGGDITAVNPGSGISGGGTSGDVIINIDNEGIKRVHMSDAAKEYGNFSNRIISANDSAYGADPSNSAAANNTAFNAFFNDLRNGLSIGDTLRGTIIKPGKYQISQTFLFGDGKSGLDIRPAKSTILEITVSDTILTTTGFNIDSRIDNLRLEGNGKNNSAVGVAFNHTGGRHLIHKASFDSIGTGLYLYDQTTVEVSNSNFDEVDIGIDANFQADNHIYRQNVSSDNNIFIKTRGGSGSLIKATSNTLGQSDSIDIVIESGAGLVSIVDNYSEDSWQQGSFGTDNGNPADGSRVIRLDGWSTQVGGLNPAGKLFSYHDNDIASITHFHATGSSDSNIVEVGSNALRLFGHSNYAAVMGAGVQLDFAGIEYDSVFSGIMSFNNPFFQRANLNGYTAGKGYQMTEVFNFTDGQKAWQIKKTGATNRLNTGSVSVSMEGAFMGIGADTLAGLKAGAIATTPAAASNANAGNLWYRRYTNSSRDEWWMAIRDGSNGYKNFDLLENRDSIFVPVEILTLGGGAVNPATKDTLTTSTPNYPFWAFDDAAQEYIVVKMNVPVGVIGTTYRLLVDWYATATSGNVYWGVRPYYTAVGSDPEIPTNGNWAQFADNPHGTAGRKVRAVWNFTMPSGLVPGQSVYLFFRRNANHAVDTMSGDAKVTDIYVKAFRAWGDR